MRVMQCARFAGLAGVVRWRHVGRRTRKEDAIDVRQDLGDIQRRFEHGNQHRQAIGRLDHGGDVFLAHGVERMRTNHASIGWYADDGTFVASHNNGAGIALSIIFYGLAATYRARRPLDHSSGRPGSA
jgi:hypothetical protein